MTAAPGTGPGGAEPDKLTTDPPLPPGVPDVDELVGDPVTDPTRAGGRARPEHEDVDGGGGDDGGDGDGADPVSVEPPD